VLRLIRACEQRFGGVTRANPEAPHPYKGSWVDSENQRVFTDRLTWLFVLVKINQIDDARRFFLGWKTRLERGMNQQVILIMFYPVHTVGDYL
jgi:hypothetical protein